MLIAASPLMMPPTLIVITEYIVTAKYLQNGRRHAYDIDFRQPTPLRRFRTPTRHHMLR